MNQEILNLVMNMDASGASNALLEITKNLEKFAVKGTQSLEKLANATTGSLGAALGILSQFKEGTKKMFYAGKETKAFAQLRAELHAFSEETKVVMMSTFDEVAAMQISGLRSNAPIQKGERKLFKSIPDSAIAKPAQQDYAKLRVEYEKIIEGYTKGNIPLKESVNKIKLIKMEVSSVRKYWGAVVGYLKQVKQKEQEVLAQLTLNKDITNQVLKGKKNWVSVAGILINTNTKVFNQYESMRGKVQELVKEEEQINSRYRTQVTLQKEILDYLVRNKKPLMEIEAQKNRVIALEKEHMQALDGVKAKAMEINKVVSKGDAYANIVGNLDKQIKSINMQRKSVEISNELLNKDKSRVVIADTLISKQNTYYNKSRNIRSSLEHINISYGITAQHYERIIEEKRKGLELMRKEKVGAELVEAASKDILELEKRRNTELDKIRQEVLKIERAMSVGGSRKEINKMEADLKKLAVGARSAAKATSSFGLSNKAVSEGAIRMGGATTGIMQTFSRWRNRILVLTFAMAGLIRGMKRFIDMSAEVGKQTRSLEVVATNLGLSINKVQKAAEYLARDGVISIAEATQAMKSLLSMGASLDVVVDNLEMMKDAAMANGRAMFSVGENLIAYAQGVKEGKSQTSDSAGVMKNMNTIAKEQAELIKKVGYANAILMGFTKEATQFEGTRAKVMEELSGKMQLVEAQSRKTKVALGKVLEPVAKEILNTYSILLSYVKNLVDENKTLLSVFTEGIGQSISKAILLVSELGTAFVKTISPLVMFAKGLVDVVTLIGKINVGGHSWLSWVTSMIITFKILEGVIKMLRKTFIVKFLNEAIFYMGLLIKKAATLGEVMAVVGQSFMAILPNLGFVAVIIAIGLVIQHLVGMRQELQRLKKIDEERVELAKTFLYNLEQIEEVSSIIGKIQEKESWFGKGSFQRLIDVTDQLNKAKEKMEALKDSSRKFTMGRATSVAPISLSETGSGRLGEVNNQLNRQKDIVKDLQEEHKYLLGLFGDEFKELEKLGIRISDNLEILDTKGNAVFSVSMKYFDTWVEVMREVEGTANAIPRLQEEMKKLADTSKDSTRELQMEIDAISSSDSEQKILNFWVTYEKRIFDVKEAQKKLTKDIGTTTEDLKSRYGALAESVTTDMYAGMFKEVDFSKIGTDEEYNKFLKIFEGVSDFASEGFVAQVGNIIKSIKAYKETISDSDKAFKIFKENLGVNSKWLPAVVTQSINKMSKELDNFDKELSKFTDNMEREIESAKNELNILLASEDSSKYKVKLDLDIVKMNSDKLNAIAEIEDKIKDKVAGTTIELQGARNAINKMAEGTDKYKSQLDLIGILESRLLSYETQKESIVSRINDLYDIRNKILQEQYRISQQERTEKMLDRYMKTIEASNNFKESLETTINKIEEQSGLYADQFLFLKGRINQTQEQLDLETKLMEIRAASAIKEIELNSKIDTRINTIKGSLRDLKEELKHIVTMPKSDEGVSILSQYLGVAALKKQMRDIDNDINKLGTDASSEEVDQLVFKLGEVKANYDEQNKALGRITTKYDEIKDLTTIIGNEGTFVIKGNLLDASNQLNTLVNLSTELAAIDSYRGSIAKSISDELERQVALEKIRATIAAQQKADSLISDLRAKRGADLSLPGIVFGGTSEKATRTKRLEEIKVMLADKKNITGIRRESLIEEQDYLNKTNEFWYTYGDAVARGTTQVLTTLMNYYMQYKQTMSQIESTRKTELAAIREQNRLKLLSDADFFIQEDKINKNAQNQEELAGYKAIQNAAAQTKTMLAARALEWSVLALVEFAKGTALAAGWNPAGHFAAAAAYGAAAVAAGLGALAAGSIEKDYATKAANFEGTSGANLEGMYGTGTNVTGVNQASTYGSTIQGQPMNVTINPTVYIEGQLIGIGAKGVQELEDGLTPLLYAAMENFVGEGRMEEAIGGSA